MPMTLINDFHHNLVAFAAQADLNFATLRAEFYGVIEQGGECPFQALPVSHDGRQEQVRANADINLFGFRFFCQAVHNLVR